MWVSRECIVRLHFKIYFSDFGVKRPSKKKRYGDVGLPVESEIIIKKDVAQRSGSERIQSEFKHCPNGNTVRSLTITSSFQLLAVGLLVEYCGRNIAVAGRCALARHLPPAPHWSESVLVKHVKCHGFMG